MMISRLDTDTWSWPTPLIVLSTEEERSSRSRSATVFRVGLRGHGIVGLESRHRRKSNPEHFPAHCTRHLLPSRFARDSLCRSRKLSLRGWRRRAANNRGSPCFPTVFTLFVAMRIEQWTVHDLRSSAECDCLADGFFVSLSARSRKRRPPIIRETLGTSIWRGDQRVYLVDEILRGAWCGRENLNVGTSSNGRAEGRTKMEPTTDRHAYDVAILILAGVIWPPMVVVEMVTALMMVRPSSPHYVAALLSLRGLT